MTDRDLTTAQLWELVDGLDALPDLSFELEVEQLMQCDGLDRDEAELMVMRRWEKEDAA